MKTEAENQSRAEINRRQFLAAVGSTGSIASVSGCLGVLSASEIDPRYPGGTVVIENNGDRSLAVSLSVVEDAYDATIETSVPAGETQVRREFVDADPGEVVTLSARLGGSGDPATFKLLPAGGEHNARPEIARLTVQNAVEASVHWTAERGER